MSSTKGHTPIFINKKKFETDATSLTGIQIKALAGYAADYDLFLLQGEGDPAGQQILDGQAIAIKPGMHFRAIPGNRNFGEGGLPIHVDRLREIEAVRKAGYHCEVLLDGPWLGLVIDPFPIPRGAFNATTTPLLLRVPMDPNGALDMFWTSVGLKLAGGQIPHRAETIETHFGTKWRRFSWHMQGVPWIPGRDTPLSYLEFVTNRFAQGV